ncbi:MAG: class I SAM-dependent methyltransferase [Myxococcota bacterium]
MSNLTRRIKSRITHAVLPPPVTARHLEYSMLLSADDERYRPTERLLDVALSAAQLARKIDVSSLAGRVPTGIRFAEVWPGEHYKLLAGLVKALGAMRVVEIGTATGLSALTLLLELPPGGKLTTFDVVPWRQYYDGTVLQQSDFADGRLVQVLDDLQQPSVVAQHRAVLEEADFIFIDAAKDGVMEQRFIDNLKPLVFRNAPIVMFDDIRVWNMLKIWRQLDRPKLDLTSFGHWSGTGLVDWTARS